jgi:hypothetical protein
LNTAAPISLPPLTGSERLSDIASQRTLPLPRSSPTSYQPPGLSSGIRVTDLPNPYRPGSVSGAGAGPGTGPGTTSPQLERSESDAADALAGLAGFSSSTPKPDSQKQWEPPQSWPRKSP